MRRRVRPRSWRRSARAVLEDWNRLNLEAQRARRRDVPIEEWLEEVLAWWAALLAAELERPSGSPRARPALSSLGALPPIGAAPRTPTGRGARPTPTRRDRPRTLGRP